MFDIFIQGLFTEHLVLSKSLGLAIFAVQVHSLKESLLSSVRFTFFMLFMLTIGVMVRPFFLQSSSIFFLCFMATVFGLISLLLNIILPHTVLGNDIVDIIRRGDPLVFLGFSAIMEKGWHPMQTFIFGLGEILGVVILFILMASFLENFNLHRLRVLRAISWRMGILSLLSFLIS